MDERRQKAFDFAAEATKQLITIASAIIAFTVTFAKDFLGNVASGHKWIAAVAWFFYFLSIVSGVLTMYALAGQLEPGGEETAKPSIWGGGATLFMGAQQIFFAVAVLVTFLFGILALYSPAPTVQPNPPATVSASPSPSPSPH
ncbi:MAG TPA: hypothetical protein VFS76_01275 [Pyrinomonadaceae bacterium]|nr:hypothetical protein [Pyrinomonadaceae bacterium]